MTRATAENALPSRKPACTGRGMRPFSTEILAIGSHESDARAGFGSQIKTRALMNLKRDLYEY
jgi:hypothetical protein